MTKAEERASREKQHEREVLISRTKLVLIVLCLIAIPTTFLVNHWDIGGVRGQVTKIESPCLRYGSDSKICERAFEEAASSINHRMACFFQHRAGVHPPSCRGVHLRIKPARNPGRVQAKPTSETQSGGDASTPTKVHSQPSPHGGGGETGSGHQPSHQPGTHQPEGGSEPSGGALPSSPPASSPPQSSSSTVERSTESTVVVQPPPPVAEAPKAPVAEAVGGVVESVGGTVTGTVESVTEPVCALTKLLCHE